MEKIEDLENNICEADTFLTGVQKSLDEIKNEVSIFENEHLLEIKQLHERIDYLLKEIPTDFQVKIKNLISTFFNYQNIPFTLTKRKISKKTPYFKID